MRKRLKKPPKLNLIPILDAIFIFIFFLLMSAQFLDIYEIGTDAPITSSTETLPKDKKPLNLTFKLSGDTITITTGLSEDIYKKFKVTELAKMNRALIELKKKNPTEDSVILKPNSTFKYDKIVRVIDYTREIKQEGVFITALDKANRNVPTNKLFAKIIFDTQE